MGGQLLTVGLLVGAAIIVAACAPAGATDTTPVPTFATPSAAAGGGTGLVRGDELPADCAELLSTADLGALMGLPLDSVAVRSTVGVPEPSVGRTERLACRYTGTAAAGPFRGDTLLDINVGRYTDADAAANQWRVNADVEDGQRTDLPIGAARAALFDRPRESVLMVTYDDDTLTFVLPEGPRPGGRSRGDVLVDFALRVLPAVGPAESRTAAPSPTPSPIPGVAAG